MHPCFLRSTDVASAENTEQKSSRWTTHLNDAVTLKKTSYTKWLQNGMSKLFWEGCNATRTPMGLMLDVYCNKMFVINLFEKLVCLKKDIWKPQREKKSCYFKTKAWSQEQSYHSECNYFYDVTWKCFPSMPFLCPTLYLK